MNKKYLVAAVGAALAVAGTSAHALDAKLSGAIARGLMLADDGISKELQNVDPASSSRFRFTGTDDLMPGVKVGIQWEMEFISNGSNDVTNSARSTASTLAERHQQVYFQGAFGKLGFGQSDGAANGITEMDLSGSGTIASMVITDYAGSYAFQKSDKTGAGPAIKAAINNLDFESRYDRLRYDTPSFGGVAAAVSTGVKSNVDVKEVAVTYSGDFGAGGKLAAGVGYSTKNVLTTDYDIETKGGSVSWLAPMGLSVTYGQSNVDNFVTKDVTAKEKYLKVGFTMGEHSMAVETARGDDQAAKDDEAKMFGVGYVFKPKSWAELFAGYRIFSLDRPAVDYEKIKLLTVGSKIKF